jgi:hypothetical protein
MYSMPRSSRLDALEIYVNIGDVLPAGLILQIEPKYFGAINMIAPATRYDIECPLPAGAGGGRFIAYVMFSELWAGSFLSTSVTA